MGEEILVVLTPEHQEFHELLCLRHGLKRGQSSAKGPELSSCHSPDPCQLSQNQSEPLFVLYRMELMTSTLQD